MSSNSARETDQPDPSPSRDGNAGGRAIFETADAGNERGAAPAMARFSPPGSVASETTTTLAEVGGGRRVSNASVRRVSDASVVAGRGSRIKPRGSSLEMRRKIPDNRLSGIFHDPAAVLDEESGTGDAPGGGGSDKEDDGRGCFSRLFLRPSYPLQRQMLLTFGSISSMTILLVVIVSVAALISTGNAIKKKSNDNFKAWVDELTAGSSRLLAETISPKLVPSDLIEILAEAARDRFSGYPLTEDDSETPFFDPQSQGNAYPLKNKPLPFDWDFRHTPNEGGNVVAANAAEHVQERGQWYSSNPRLSTAVAMYTMQGACNPFTTDSSDLGYYPNCTYANNDVSTGGIVAPNPTNEQVYRKAADLSPFLKALYESHQDITSHGYYFSNSGAGSSVTFPHYELDSSGSYVSIGCEWMRGPNPIDASLGPIGTEEEIARCHPKGVEVLTREYNPLERAWCRDQALDPSRVHARGPYRNAWKGEEHWLMSTGRAVYDRVTNAFVCCVLADVDLAAMNKILQEVKFDELGIITLVRNDDAGTVIMSSEFDFGTADSTTAINDPLLETGVDVETYQIIKSKVNFSQTWDPEEARKEFMKPLSEGDHIISTYPIPEIPEDYDSTYAPFCFAIFSLPKAVGLARITEKVDEEVDSRVRSFAILSVAVGFAGLAVVILLIFATSSWFVQPLTWMNRVGEQVVGKFGQEEDASIAYDKRKPQPCSPRTELNELEDEFKTTVARFSGEGTAKRMETEEKEKLNLFDYAEDFADLYRSRSNSAFPFNYPKSSSASDATGRQSINQCNLVPITKRSPEPASCSTTPGSTVHSKKIYKSPLFLWMTVFIVTPTLTTTVIISAVVLWQIYNELPFLVTPVEEQYYALREAHRFTKTEILAIRASGVTERAARDTHLLTRFASWLYFGGMEVTPGVFIELLEGAEECKTAPSRSECEWTKNIACDCAWNNKMSVGDKSGSCIEYPPGESRALQKIQFGCQSQDTNPDGSRYNTSFPAVAEYANTTAWWDNTTVLPRLTKNSLSSKYDTSFDRAKIISALSAVFVPLYHYDKSKDKPLGMYIGFEADGMMAGYSGCDINLATIPFWRSSEENGAALLSPELCPLNKYGYDPRCRGWYHDGKLRAESGNGTLHITSPYKFASSNNVGQSISSPLIDPRNNKHIGQVLVDFLPSSTFKALEREMLVDNGFPIMIATESDVLGHDTIFAPGYSLGDGGKSVTELLLPNDAFDTILRDMKAGKSGTGFFDGNVGKGAEQINITFAPVVVRSYRPVNSTDISRGVDNETTLVYSLALAETTAGIEESFQSIRDSSSATANICIWVLLALILMSTLLIIYVAFRVTASMAEPILQLLNVMKDINCMQLSNDDISQLSKFKGSCREVDSVYKTIEVLYKVVQFANSAFFGGELDVAFHVLGDALRLFTRLDNKKAIAITSNNLGNTMLTIYRTMVASGKEEMCDLTKNDVIEKGTAYFVHSIKLGEELYDQFYNEQGWSEECLVFMQYLANRYFNRAIFLLTTSGNNANQKDAEAMGFRDLQIAADMDVEIVDQCLEMGFKIDRVERYELMMSRVRGLLALAECGHSPDELFVEDQIKEIYQDLVNAMKNPSHELFEKISVAGRMQKLDTELMKYFSQVKRDNTNAARVAIRMLVEDKYIFPDAELEAVKMLLAYMNTTEDENRPKDESGVIAKELKSDIDSLDHAKCLMTQRTTALRSLNRSTSALSSRDMGYCLIESNRGDVTMELY